MVTACVGFDKITLYAFVYVTRNNKNIRKLQSFIKMPFLIMVEYDFLFYLFFTKYFDIFDFLHSVVIFVVFSTPDSALIIFL